MLPNTAAACTLAVPVASTQARGANTTSANPGQPLATTPYICAHRGKLLLECNPNQHSVRLPVRHTPRPHLTVRSGGTGLTVRQHQDSHNTPVITPSPHASTQSPPATPVTTHLAVRIPTALLQRHPALTRAPQWAHTTTSPWHILLITRKLAERVQQSAPRPRAPLCSTVS